MADLPFSLHAQKFRQDIGPFRERIRNPCPVQMDNIEPLAPQFPESSFHMGTGGRGIGRVGFGDHDDVPPEPFQPGTYVGVGLVQLGRIDHGHPPLQGVANQASPLFRAKTGLQRAEREGPVDQRVDRKSG